MPTTLCDLTASARQLSLCASVSLVLAVFGPPLAHGCYHNAVHVEPGLTQRCCVGLAKTALQHVEKGLTHHLKKSKTNKNTNTQKKKSFFHSSFICIIAFRELYYEMLFLQQMTGCWLPLPDASSRGWAGSPPRSEGHPGGSLLHRAQASPGSMCTYTQGERSKLCTRTNCTLVAGNVANRAHLGDMFQELWAGEAVLCGAKVCAVVEKTEERRVQLKQSTTDKYHTVL